MFSGKVMHSRQFSCMDAAQGKDVVIVGSGKAAEDLAVEIATAGQPASVTMLFRLAHWWVGRWSLGLGSHQTGDETDMSDKLKLQAASSPSPLQRVVGTS